MGILPLFHKQSSEVVTLELNWLLPAAIPGFMRELEDEFNFLNWQGKLNNLSFTNELFNRAIIASIRKGYSLRMQPIGKNRYRLNYDRKAISKPNSVKRWFEGAVKRGESPFELRYGNDPALRAALPLRLYRGGVHCLTVNGYRNFRLEHIRSIHPVAQARLGTDALLEFEWSRGKVRITQGLVMP